MLILVFDNDYYNGAYVVIQAKAPTTKDQGYLYVEGAHVGDGEWIDNRLDVVEHAIRCGCVIKDQGTLFEPEDHESTTHELVVRAVNQGIIFDAVCDVNKG